MMNIDLTLINQNENLIVTFSKYNQVSTGLIFLLFGWLIFFFYFDLLRKKLLTYKTNFNIIEYNNFHITFPYNDKCNVNII